MTSRDRSGVFLSYARKDGEPFAAMLRDRLRENASDIVVKQDRTLLEGGVGWWKQLTEAIDSVEFVLLVMTPSSMQSEMVRKEWRYARQQGICVYPVKGAPDSALRFADLPRWMSKAHFFDIDREWESLVSHLRKGCETARVPFMAPDLPENFIKRPNEFGRLKSLLLSPDRKDAVANTTALSGAGGFGKTTLAAALCHDEDIVQNFDDGILWVTLGQNPNIMGSLVTAYAALSGERPGFANEEDAAFQLGHKLEDRTCLLVIDDVWDEAHLRPFLRGGRGCARLFTTRMAGIGGAHSVHLEEMREAESLQLLVRGVPGLETTRAREVSARLGEWPIALELAVAMIGQRIKQGDSADRAAQKLLQILDRRGPRGLAGTTGLPQHRSIDGVLVGSLELLDRADRTRLTELSIFPPNIQISLTAVAALWGLDELESEETAQRLARLSLLKLDLGRGSIRLHDLIRNWLALETTNTTELHSRLVDTWTDWTNLPDRYAWLWLPWHLVQAGRREDTEKILWDPRWLRAKLQATDVIALIGDFDQLKPAREAELIQDALRLSSHILAKDPSHFTSQLTGRLLPHEERVAVHRFIRAIGETADHPWLRPLNRALDSPGTGLVRTLAGHSGSVTAVAVTPDGLRAVSVSDDQTLKVWDLESGSELRTLPGHPDPAYAVMLTPDGRRALSAAGHNTLKATNPETDNKIRALEAHSLRADSVVMAQDTLKICDLETGEMRALGGHSGPIYAAVVTPDGRRAVSASWDKTLKVWDLETGGELCTLAGHSGPVHAVAVTPDGRRAVSASDDKTLKVWDLEPRSEVRAFSGHSNYVLGLAVTPDRRYAVSASGDNTLKVWDLESGGELRTLAGHSASVFDVAVTPDGRHAVSASMDNTLKVWDLETGAPIRTLEGHEEMVIAVAVTPDGRHAVSASWDTTLKAWELETGKEEYALSGHLASVSDVAITPDGRHAVSASDDKTLKVWNLEMGAEVRSLTGHSDLVRAVAVTPDGQHVVSASADKTLKIWHLESGNEIRTLTGHADRVNGVAVTPDGGRVFSASGDNTIKVWDFATGEMIATFVCDASARCCVCAGNRKIVAGDEGGRIYILALETPLELKS